MHSRFVAVGQIPVDGNTYFDGNTYSQPPLNNARTNLNPPQSC